MDPAPEKPRDETPAPSRNVRLAWWLGIYLAGCGPLVVPPVFSGLSLGGLHGLAAIFEFPPILPMGLWIHLSKAGISPDILIYVWPVFYGIYVLHFVLTMRTAHRMFFGVLMIIFIVLVTFSSLGLYQMINELASAVPIPD